MEQRVVQDCGPTSSAPQRAVKLYQVEIQARFPVSSSHVGVIILSPFSFDVRTTTSGTWSNGCTTSATSGEIIGEMGNAPADFRRALQVS